MRDLKESGAIEQDADIIMLLARNEVNQGIKYTEWMTSHVVKNRNGRVGDYRMLFYKYSGLMEEQK